MPRVRISTTVSDTLLDQARSTDPALSDAALLDRALSALCAKHRAAEVDRPYRVFDEVPLETEDEWGNLAEFLEAAEGS